MNKGILLRTSVGRSAVVTLQAGSVPYHLKLLAFRTGIAFIAFLAGFLYFRDGEGLAFHFQFPGDFPVLSVLSCPVSYGLPGGKHFGTD